MEICAVFLRDVYIRLIWWSPLFLHVAIESVLSEEGSRNIWSWATQLRWEFLMEPNTTNRRCVSFFSSESATVAKSGKTAIELINLFDWRIVLYHCKFSLHIIVAKKKKKVVTTSHFFPLKLGSQWIVDPSRQYFSEWADCSIIDEWFEQNICRQDSWMIRQT